MSAAATILQARAERADLEASIALDLLAFEDSTGARVQSITVERVDAAPCEYDAKPAYRVTVEARV